MSLFSRILAVLVVIAVLPLAYFALSVMNKQHTWRTISQQYEAALEVLPQVREPIIYGDPALRGQEVGVDHDAMRAVADRQPLLIDAPSNSPAGQLNVAGRRIPLKVLAPGSPGTMQIGSALHSLMVHRGMVWRGVQRGTLDADTGEVTVTVPDPSPHGIKPNMVLHLFDEAEKAQGGAFLGSFRVQDATDTGATLAPLRSLSDRQKSRLSGSRGPWVLYDVMPRDRYDIYAHLSEDDLRAMLPAEIAEQVLLHGKPLDQVEAGGDEPPAGMNVLTINNQRVLNRPLRNFNVALGHYHRLISLARDSMIALTNDLALVRASKDDTDKQIAQKETEIERMQADLAKTQAERKLINDHRDALAAQLGELQQQREQLLAENRRLAEEIAAASTPPSLLPAPSPSDGTVGLR